MKIKFLLLSIIAIGSFTQTNAQFHIGAKAGANISKLNGVSYRDKYKLGYQVGGFVGYDINKIIGLQTEVLFNQTNTSVEDGAGPVFENAFRGNKRLNYLSVVPVLVKIFPQSIVSLHAGPQFSILTNRDKTALENGQQLFKSSDLGVLAGAEVNLGALSIYGRYVWGFKDISDIGGKAKSQQAQVGLAFKFL